MAGWLVDEGEVRIDQISYGQIPIEKLVEKAPRFQQRGLGQLVI